MTAVQFHKVTTLPGTPEANSFYFVENGGYSESYLTDDAGVAKAIGNSVMINTLADARIVVALSTLNRVEIVADIAARDALNTRDYNFMVLVLDATADATVDSGAALYVFQNSDNSFTKIAEYEGLDVTVTWDSISGKPSSTPADIDDAVTKRQQGADRQDRRRRRR